MRTTYAVVLAGIVCLLTACGTLSVQTTQNRAAAYTALTTRQAGQLTAQQEAWLADLCPRASRSRVPTTSTNPSR